MSSQPLVLRTLEVNPCTLAPFAGALAAGQPVDVLHLALPGFVIGMVAVAGALFGQTCYSGGGDSSDDGTTLVYIGGRPVRSTTPS